MDIRLENKTIVADMRNQDIDSSEVREHLHANKEVATISVVWKDNVEFTLSSKRVLSKLNFKKFCAEDLKSSRSENKEDIRAQQEGELIVYMSALVDLWKDVANIPEEL